MNQFPESHYIKLVPKGAQVSQQNPCPICGKPDWCFLLPDGEAVNCQRSDQAPPGWSLCPRKAKDGSRIFRPKKQKKTLFYVPPTTDMPCWRKTGVQNGEHWEQEIEYFYSPRQKVVRKQWTDRRKVYRPKHGEDKNKEIRPWHLAGGRWKLGRGDQPWPLYRENEAHQLETLFFVGGEQCVEKLRSFGFSAVCNQGGEGSSLDSTVERLKELKLKKLVIWPDNDETGRRASQKLLEACGQAGVPAIVLDPFKLHPNAPDKWDVADWDISLKEAQKIIQGAVQELSVKMPQVHHPLALARERLRPFLTQNLSPSELRISFTQLSEETEQTVQQIEKLYKDLQEEEEALTAAEAASKDLQQAQAIRNQQLPIRQGLYGDGGDLAQKIYQVAEAMPTAPEFLVTTLIPMLAAAIGTSSQLMILPTAGYSVPCIFRSIIVAKTGCKKTPAQKAILNVFHQLEEIAYETYQLNLEQYEIEHRQWSQVKPSKDPEPKKPTRKRYISTDDTPAARIQLHIENLRGVLLYRDEASAFINERGRFTSGKGDGGELEADLSEFNGGAVHRDRKADGGLYLPRTAINRVGAIQFSTLQRLMGSHSDDQGEYSRYLFCAAEAPLSKLDFSKDVGDIGLTQELISLVQALEASPNREYFLAEGAKVAFQRYQNELTDRAQDTDHPAMESAFPKFEAYFGRFILWIHLVNAALAKKVPDPLVSAEHVEIARQWTEYYIGQLQFILAINSPQQSLTGDRLRVYEYLKRKNRPLKARDVVQGRLFERSRDKRKQRTPYIRELLEALVKDGWLSQAGDSYFLPTSLTVVE